jgi:hypothetical protein
VRKRLVWHGYGTEELFSDDMNAETLTSAVDAILEKYPPAAASGQAAPEREGPAEDRMPEPPKTKADDMK